jgi:hypothetical protein
MAVAGKRKKTTTVVEDIPEGTPVLDTGETSGFDFDLQRADDAETVDQILRDNGIAGVLYRFYDNDGGYCYSSSDLDYDRARQETGGGKNCKLGVFVNGKLMRMVPFPLAVLQRSVNGNGNGSGNGSGFSDSKSDFLEKQIQRNHELLLTAMTAQRKEGPSLTELVASLASLDNMRGKQESTMDLFLKGVEFAQGVTGQTPDWKTDLVRTVKESFPQFMEMFSGMRQHTNGNGTALPASNLPTLPNENMIKAGIAYLKKKVIAGVDPELIIEWIVNNAEEYQGLLAIILNQQFADIAKFDPEIGAEPFVGWFLSLFNGLRSAFTGPRPVDNDSGGDVGDESDVGNHGEPRKERSAKPKD